MRVYQALWDENRSALLLWGEWTKLVRTVDENSLLEALEEEVSSSLHPFSVPQELMAQDLEALGLENYSAETVQMYLPSFATYPLYSPHHRLSKNFQEGEIDFLPWEIPVLRIGTLEALYFLSSLSLEPRPGVLLDDSLLYWVEVVKLLLELLTRGRFIPGLHASREFYRSNWELVPNEQEDAQRLALLISGMPAICRVRVMPQKNDDLPRKSAADYAKGASSSIANRAMSVDSFGLGDGGEIVRIFLQRSANAVIRSFAASIAVHCPRLEASSEAEKAAASWLSSLLSPEAKLVSGLTELSRLSARLERWRGVLQSHAQYVLHCGFRLLEPVVEQDKIKPTELNWRLEFLVVPDGSTEQAQDLSALWQGALGTLASAGQSAEELEEKILIDLYRAALAWPPLLGALKESFPSAMSLSTAEAYSFLREGSPLLRELGFVVLHPKWWDAPAEALGLRLSVDTPKTSSARERLNLEALVKFHWQLALGGEELSLADFRSMVESQVGLINIAGRWLEIKPAQAKKALEVLEKSGEDHLRIIDVLRMGLGGDYEGLPIVSFSASDWLERFIDSKTAASDVEQPHAFDGTLRPYQREGLSWLSFLTRLGCGACLADDMGLGKTVQFIALLLHEREELRGVSPAAERPTLLVVPMSIIENWRRELARFGAGLRVYVHHGSLRAGAEEFVKEAQESDVVLSTYNLVYRDEKLMHSVRWGRIALDEAQAIKNLQTKQTRAVRELCQVQLASSGEEKPLRVVLTGTPLENHLEELWSILDFLNPGYLGSLREFRSRYAVPIERYRQNEQATKLARLIQPFVLRRLKSDASVISDLPQKLEMEVLTSLTKEQASLYQSCLDEMLPQVEIAEGLRRKGLVLAAITRLKQICDHPQLVLHDGGGLSGRSGKLTLLHELLEVILESGEKTLIFTQYAQMGELLKRSLEERFDQEVLFLHGKVPQATRQRLVDTFQSNDGPAIFVLSLKVGGLGLNLTAATQVIHYDQWWNPAVQDQATDRAYRIGQTKNVQVRKLIVRGTLEERIAEMLKRKREVATSVVRASREGITELSSAELRSLLELSSDAEVEEEEERNGD